VIPSRAHAKIREQSCHLRAVSLWLAGSTGASTTLTLHLSPRSAAYHTHTIFDHSLAIERNHQRFLTEQIQPASLLYILHLHLHLHLPIQHPSPNKKTCSVITTLTRPRAPVRTEGARAWAAAIPSLAIRAGRYFALLCLCALPALCLWASPTKREPASADPTHPPTTLPPSKQTSLHHHYSTRLTTSPPNTSHCITAVALLAAPHHPPRIRLLTRASGLTSVPPSPSASPTRRSAHSQGHRLCVLDHHSSTHKALSPSDPGT
jgi:hypothetical protein